jgi:hypothetical protein
MIPWIRSHIVWVATGGALALAGTTGFLASQALGGATAGPPVTTTTVNIGAGSTGPSGPAGPAGPSGPTGPAGAGGADQCPTGSTFQAVVLNQPGGHLELWVCVKTP